MIYLGTENAKILSYPLKELYEKPIQKAAKVQKYQSLEEYEELLGENEKELAELLRNSRQGK